MIKVIAENQFVLTFHRQIKNFCIDSTLLVYRTDTEQQPSGSCLNGSRRFSFIAEFYEEWEDCEPEGSFFSQISPHLKPDTIRKIHTLPLNFQLSDRVSKQACS